MRQYLTTNEYKCETHAASIISNQVYFLAALVGTATLK